MEIIRENFGLDQIVDTVEIINNLHVFYMEENDIITDDIVFEEKLAENESLLVMMHISNNVRTSFCYVKIRQETGLDNESIAIIVEKIIMDDLHIDKILLDRLFTIILQQQDTNLTNRIIVPTKINCRFHNNIKRTANEIAEYIVLLYTNYTNSFSCKSYIIN